MIKPTIRARSVVVAALVASVLAASCTQIVGPARTEPRLRAQGRDHRRLGRVVGPDGAPVMRLGRDDDAFAAYMATMASESEDGATAAAGTFSGIQPPDDAPTGSAPACSR